MIDTPRLRLESVSRSLAFVVMTALILALVPLARPANAAAGTIEVTAGDGLVPAIRFAGFNRYDTAELIATDDTEFAPDYSGDTVILATGERFPDALAGSTLAGLEGAPIVLTPRFLDDGELEEDTAEALDEIDPSTVYILGGVEAISAEVEDKVADDYDVDPIRIGGVDRYETAALIADETSDETSTAIVARGGQFPDALVSGAFAAALGLPLLLTPEDTPLDDDMVDRLDSLDIERVILLGGVEALSQDVEDAISDLGIEVVRVFGVDRYGTAVELAEQAEELFGLEDFGVPHANLARGDDFPDALTFGPHAGLDYPGPSPIVLTQPSNLNDDTAAYFTSIASPDFEALHVAGGIEAILPEVVEEARELLTVDEPAALFLTPETATNFVGETHTVTATVVNNGGAGVADVDVAFAFDETDTSGVPETATATTDDDGTASVDFRSTTPGEVTVTATVTDAAETLTATATKTFVLPSTTAYTLDVTGLALSSFDSADGTPETATAAITGTGGAPLVGMDFRPRTGDLYALDEDGILYTIDPATGVADVETTTAVADFSAAGLGVGFDFNPAADALRIVDSTDRNFRLTFSGDVVTGIIADGTLNPGGANVSHAAYANSVFQPETVSATTLYDIGTGSPDTLFRQSPANSGTLIDVGELGVDVAEGGGFDIYSPAEGRNVALAALSVGVDTSVYFLDLDTGEASPLYDLPAQVSAFTLAPDFDSFAVDLSADNEEPEGNDTGATGSAFVALDDDGLVCYSIAVDKGSATGTFAGSPGAHIHEAGPDANGPIVVQLGTPSDGTGTVDGCTEADPDLVAEIAAAPGDYYVNVHTTDFPAGLVRGQLDNDNDA